MTRYNRPAEGTTDWHIPLNENFQQLETDVEIRDIAANLGTYAPAENAKFLATDTGAVYLGDGTQWHRLGEIVPEESGSGGGSGGWPVRTAGPGSLQDTLDAAGDAAGSLDSGAREAVATIPGKTYTDPIFVPEGVDLFTLGATFDINRDVDVLTLDSGSNVFGTATINVDSVSAYTSSAILVDCHQSSSHPIAMGAGQETTANMWGMFRCIGDQPGTGMDSHTGAAFELRGAPTRNGQAHFITHCAFGRIMARGFNNALLCDAQGFLNDNYFHGFEMVNCNYGFHHINTSTAKNREAKVFVTSGHMQLDDFQHGFWNELPEKSIRYYGHVEDPQRCQDNIVKGPMMKLFPSARWNFSQTTQTGADKADWGVGTTVNGVGFLEGGGDSPSAVTNGSEYYGGEFVAFKDTGDGSGDGLYMKGPWQGTNAWVQVSDQTVAPAGGNG